MRTLVCVKSVLGGDTLSFNPGLNPNSLPFRRGNEAQTVNPADCTALEQAFRLKERHGGFVTVLSMGPPATERLLRELCALPADNVVLVTDPLYAGSDSLATARILAAAATRLGGFDLILAGRRAIDGETGHVGPELAALLGIASCLTNVTGDCWLDAGAILCSRLLENRLLSLRVSLPAVLTVCGDEYTLRPPSIAGLRNAKHVDLFTNAELSFPAETVGLAGSPTVVAKICPAKESSRSVRFIHDARAGAEAILEAIRREPVRREPAEDCVPKPAFTDLFWVVSLADDPPGEQAAKELIAAARAMGATPVLLRLRGNDDVACARVLADRAKQERPAVILLPATIRGRCVAPYCAALLQTGLTADCTDLDLDGEGRMVLTRPAFGGGVMAEILCRTKPQMATVRPGVFPDGDDTLVKTVDLDAGGGGPAVVADEFQDTEGLHEAQIIVAGGRGIGSKKGFSCLEEIAKLLGAGVGATRSAVDAGYAPYVRQIGQTGTTVRPGVYIAFAVSGSIQHLAGMRESGLVLAVNTYPKAPILGHADIGIIAPWRDVAESLLQCKKDM